MVGTGLCCEFILEEQGCRQSPRQPWRLAWSVHRPRMIEKGLDGLNYFCQRLDLSDFFEEIFLPFLSFFAMRFSFLS